MNDTSRRSSWIRPLAAAIAVVVLIVIAGTFAFRHADGPVFIFAGGPLRSGELIGLAEFNWSALDALHELELEIVSAATSRTLWFSVHEGIPYVACDLDCIDGRLERWPQQIERDPRVVIRIDEQRAEGRLVHVPHETEEYRVVRTGRNRKYSGESGGRAASETAAHSTVVGVGEVLTGRDKRAEPGDRLYRIDPR